MVPPGTWSATDRITCHFGPFFALLPPNNPKNQNFERNEKETMEILPFYTSVPQIRIKRCMVPAIWSPTDRTFCQFRPFFAHLDQIFEKMKKTPGNILILNKCTKNRHRMLHWSWDKCMTDVIFTFHFGLFFALLPL